MFPETSDERVEQFECYSTTWAWTKTLLTAVMITATWRNVY
jgi:hypothetical protein